MGNCSNTPNRFLFLFVPVNRQAPSSFKDENCLGLVQHMHSPWCNIVDGCKAAKVTTVMSTNNSFGSDTCPFFFQKKTELVTKTRPSRSCTILQGIWMPFYILAYRTRRTNGKPSITWRRNHHQSQGAPIDRSSPCFRTNSNKCMVLFRSDPGMFTMGDKEDALVNVLRERTGNQINEIPYRHLQAVR